MGITHNLTSNCRSQSNHAGEFFRKLSAAALQDIASLQFPSSYGANVVLFSEKDEAKGLFIVLEGEIKVSINSSEGRRLSLSIARKGEILGLASALTGNEYDVTAETLYPTRVAHIGRSEFLNFLARHPESYKVVIEELSRQVTQGCDQLRTVGLAATAPEKLARLLLDWSDNGQPTDLGGARFRFSMTHEEIGEFIGASRETVTRTLSTFKTRRLVAFQGSMITIPSRTALADYAHA
ncbi:MAG TPA: Crp/Fnr family transcriptional regulator [Terracidiphilus sp.]|jgi:CRP/FNR family transcriptional regulator